MKNKQKKKKQKNAYADDDDDWESDNAEEEDDNEEEERRKLDTGKWRFKPFKPEFTIVIFIHYKPRIAVAILDL